MGGINQDFNNDFDIGINAWPSDLPQCPLLDNFTEQKQNNVIEFKPEVGTTKIRRRSTNALLVVSMVFKFNTSQLASFETFRRVTCKDGAEGFQFAHPVTKDLFWWMWNKKEAPVVQRITPRAFLVRFDLVTLLPATAIEIVEYVTEDGSATYVTEDGSAIYVPSN